MFAGLGDQRGGIEIRLGVCGGQHEWGSTFARENIAHDERASAVVALYEQLRFAEDADIDPGGTLPRGLFAMERVPLDDVAYAAALLFVKPLFRRGEVWCRLRARSSRPQRTSALSSRNSFRFPIAKRSERCATKLSTRP
jgi:hypothetical protein